MKAKKTIIELNEEDYKKYTKDGVLELPNGYEAISCTITPPDDVHTIVFPEEMKFIEKSLLCYCRGLENIIFKSVPETCYLQMYSVSTKVKYIVLPDEEVEKYRYPEDENLKLLYRKVDEEKFKILLDNIASSKKAGEKYDCDQTPVKIISYSEYLEISKRNEDGVTV